MTQQHLPNTGLKHGTDERNFMAIDTKYKIKRCVWRGNTTQPRPHNNAGRSANDWPDAIRSFCLIRSRHQDKMPNEMQQWVAVRLFSTQNSATTMRSSVRAELCCLMARRRLFPPWPGLEEASQLYIPAEQDSREHIPLMATKHIAHLSEMTTKYTVKILEELGLVSLWKSTIDTKLLCIQRFVRLFAYGGSTLILVAYLDALGIPKWKIGLFMTLTLVGDTLISFVLTLFADAMGRKAILSLGAILMALSGIVFALFGNYWVLLVAAIVGVVSPR